MLNFIIKRMKTKFIIIITIFFCFFISCFSFIGCDDGINSNNENNTEKTENQENNESDTSAETENSDTSDSKTVKLQNSFNWGAAYNHETKTVTFEKGWKLSGFNFVGAETLDASNYEYAELSYSDLSLPVIVFRIIYSDESYSQVYLQEHLDKAYIKLNENKKKAVKSVTFQTIMSDDYYVDSASFKLGDFKFVHEMQNTEKNRLSIRCREVLMIPLQLKKSQIEFLLAGMHPV